MFDIMQLSKLFHLLLFVRNMATLNNEYLQTLLFILVNTRYHGVEWGPVSCSKQTGGYGI